MFERLKKLATNSWSWLAPTVPAVPTRKDLTTAEGYVDPSRLIAKWNMLPYNPSWLVTRKGMQIYDQMRRDEQVKAALKFKKDSTLAPGWEVASPGDQPEDWEVTRFVRDNFVMMKGGFSQVLFNTLSALDYGHSVSEKIYKERDVGEWKGKLMVDRIQSLRPHFIDYQVDPYGVLQGVIQRNVMGAVAGGTGSLQGEPIPPVKMVIYTHAFEFGNFYGTSDLEAAYRSWWTKDNAYKWLAVTLERFGMPPLFAFYDSNAYNATDIGELKKVIKNIQNATFGIIPRTQKDALELWSQTLGKDSTELFLSALERFDHHISRALLVPDLIGLGGGSGQGAGSGAPGGSLARSRTNFDSFLQIIGQLRGDLSQVVVNDQIIPQLCDLNFPNLESYPLFRFLPPTKENIQEIMKTWAEMVAGRVVNRVEDDETHIRKVMGFPENEDPKIEPLPEKGAAVPGSEQKPPAQMQEDGSVEEVELSDDELTMEELHFAAENLGGRWVTVGGGRHVFIKDKAPMHERIHRALSTHKPATQAKQFFALAQEQRVAGMLDAERLDDNEPMDLVGVAASGRKYGVEVKAFVDNSNDKVTMHPDSLKRKLSWARKEKASLHTVVVDGRKRFGAAAKEYSGNELWYRKGVGSFRLTNMVPVRDATHLRALLSGEAKFEEELEARGIEA